MQFPSLTRWIAVLARCRLQLQILIVTVFISPGVTASHAQTFASLPSLPSVARTLGPAKPIEAWLTFCRNYPAECVLNRAEPDRITLTPAVWATIAAINRRVNKTVQPMTDMDHWGVADQWNMAEDGFGDCEDYQLLKRHLLAEAGLPRRAMRMTVVVDESGEGHAVLTLVTDRGELIVDNKTSEILPWDKTGYVFIKRESQDAVSWVSLGGVTSPAATANR